jgi:Domain of unknown function (DUF4279)
MRKIKMHSYSVEFRILSESEDLDIKAISENLGMTATNTRQRGEAKSASRVFAESMWGYSVYPEHGLKDWDSLEEALESLLAILMPLKDKIREYILKYKVVVWCGHFTSSFDGGPTFSPEVLEKLSALGVELFLDTYCSSDE